MKILSICAKCSDLFSATYDDGDGDGYLGLSCGGTDCNDTTDTIHPGIIESGFGSGVCTDGVDNDCDDLTDLQEITCRDEWPANCNEYSWCWISPQPQGNSIRAVWMNSWDQGWAVGYGGTIIHYDGVRWSIDASGTRNSLTDVWSPGADEAWVVGTNDTVLYWDGLAWTPRPTGTDSDFTAIWGVDSDNVWLVGSFQDVFHWEQSIWTQVACPNNGGLNTIWGSGPDDIWAAGDTGDLLYFNGSSWSVRDSSITTRIQSIWGFNPTEAWALVGTDQAVQWDGSSWSSVNFPGQPMHREVWEINLDCLHGSAADDIWGFCQSFAHHFDGVQWTPDSTPEESRLRTAWASGPNDVWFGGDEMRHWDGSLLERHPIPIDGGVYAICGSAPNDVWATGYDSGSLGIILHWDGNQWTVSASGLVGGIDSCFALSSTEAWAMNPTQAFLHWDGSSWSSASDLSDMHTRAVWAFSPDDVWAIGSLVDSPGTGIGGGVAHFDGSSWSWIWHDAGNHLENLLGLGPNDIYVVGSEGNHGANLHHWDGNTWSRELVTVPDCSFNCDHILSIQGTSNSDLWVTYEFNGRLLHFNGQRWVEHITGTSNTWVLVTETDIWAYNRSGSILRLPR